MIRVLIAGLAAGLVAGLFGVGGGVLLVPAIAIWLGRPQHVAHATSLVAVTMAAAIGAARFALDDAVSLLGAAALLLGSLLGARLGADLLPHIPEQRLRRGFGVVLLLLAVRFVLAGSGGDGSIAGGTVPDLTAATVAVHALGGLAAGVLSSTLGVGGGVLMVPLLVLGLGYGQHVAEGTSLAVIVPTALLGARRHARNGFTDWALGFRLGIGALAGSWLGASLALDLAPDDLARGFGVLLAAVGALTLHRGRTVSPPR